MPNFVKVATHEELPPGGKLLVDVDGRAIAVFHIIEGTYHAIDDICTHDGGPLAEGDLEGHEVECPRHGARFDVRSGKALRLPAVEPVAVHTVEARDDGVYLAVEE